MDPSHFARIIATGPAQRAGTADGRGLHAAGKPKKGSGKRGEMSVFQKIRQPQLTKLLCVNQKKIYL
jgi:hypothetical protein